VKDRQRRPAVGRAWGRATGQLRRAAGRSLVAEIRVRDLLLCAKHLSVAAISPLGKAAARPRPGASSARRCLRIDDICITVRC
jgi:hypothetical protein